MHGLALESANIGSWTALAPDQGTARLAGYRAGRKLGGAVSIEWFLSWPRVRENAD